MPRPKLTSNFAHLQSHDEQLLRLGMLAERYFADDPNTCLLKLRQLAELLAQMVASGIGIESSPDEGQYELLFRLRDRGILPPVAAGSGSVISADPRISAKRFRAGTPRKASPPSSNETRTRPTGNLRTRPSTTDSSFASTSGTPSSRPRRKSLAELEEDVGEEVGRERSHRHGPFEFARH